MKSFTEFLCLLFEAKGPNNAKLYKTAFPEQMSKVDKDKMHAERKVDADFKKSVQHYVKNPNATAPYEIPSNESERDRKRREDFHKQLHRAVGKHSDENGISSEGSGHIFRGQAHPATPDATGHITFRKATSWSTNPAVANANAHRNQNEHSTAHHIYMLHHDNATGHRVFSTVPKSHAGVGMQKEEEVVSRPGRYKLEKSEYVGNDVRTGKPVIKHHLTYAGDPVD